MSNFSSLKAAIQQYIKTNGNEEITGAVLQDILLSVVSVLGDTAINDLETALQTETTNRTNADGTLQQNITAEGNARQQADVALGGRIDGLQTAINGINTKLAEGYIYAGIATTSTNPGTPTGKVFYIATAAGTYTNFSGVVLTQGINILKYNGSAWSSEQVLAFDDVPTAVSDNPVKSGGVFNKLATLYETNDVQNYELSGTGSGILLGSFKKGEVVYLRLNSATALTIAGLVLGEGWNVNLTPSCAVLNVGDELYYMMTQDYDNVYLAHPNGVVNVTYGKCHLKTKLNEITNLSSGIIHDSVTYLNVTQGNGKGQRLGSFRIGDVIRLKVTSGDATNVELMPNANWNAYINPHMSVSPSDFGKELYYTFESDYNDVYLCCYGGSIMAEWNRCTSQTEGNKEKPLQMTLSAGAGTHHQILNVKKGENVYLKVLSHEGASVWGVGFMKGATWSGESRISLDAEANRLLGEIMYTFEQDYDTVYILNSYGTATVLFSRGILQNQIQEIRGNRVPQITFIYPESLRLDGCLWDDGTINEATAEASAGNKYSWKTTDYIFLKSGCTLKFNIYSGFGETAHYRNICVYDLQKNFEQSFPTTTNSIFSYSPLKDCFVRCSNLLGDADFKIKIEKNRFEQKDLQAFLPMIRKDSNWMGRKVVFCGTSITDFGQYRNAYQHITWANVVNFGISGSPLADYDGQHTDALVNRFQNIPVDAELIVIEEGINDSRTPIGDPDDLNIDGSKNNTFYGALYYTLRGILQAHPKIPVVFMTPHHYRYDGSIAPVVSDYNIEEFENGHLVENVYTPGVALSERVAAIKKVCEFFAIPVIDLHAISTLQPMYSWNAAIYTSDGIHLSAYGGLRFAKIIEPILENVDYEYAW